MTHGLFITFEGGDGVGKTTHIATLAKRLTQYVATLDKQQFGRAQLAQQVFRDLAGPQQPVKPVPQYYSGVVTTCEPGGTALGIQLRNIILHGEPIDMRTEALLYAADRAHHVATVIRPALEAQKIVISDRYIDSSIAYQAEGRQLDADDIRHMSTWATDGLMPDLTFLLDASPHVALKRLSGKPDRLEQEGSAFHERVRYAFLRAATREEKGAPSRWRIIDTSQPFEAASTEIFEHVMQHVGELPQ